MSMTDILQRIAEGADVEAFRRLFEAYAPRIKSYMMRQGADAHTAEELAQETLLTVWRKAALYSGEKGSATTWIFTIARNLRIDKLRKEMTWVALPEGYDQEVSHDANPDEALAEEERRVRVQQALAGLPPISTRLSFCLTWMASRTAKLPIVFDCRSAPSNRACGSRI